MQIQVTSDSHIEATTALIQSVEEALTDKLRRFNPRITRVIVNFTDSSSAAKSAGDDKRCVIEARLNGLQPVSVSDRGEAVLQALNGATRKLIALLESTLGKLEDRR